MQLSGLLEKLRGFFTTAFLISTVVPLLSFIFVNTAIFAQFNPSVGQLISGYLSTNVTGKATDAAFFFLGLVVIGYLFATLNLTLRQVLEGEKFLPRWFESWLLTLETARLNSLRSALYGAQKSHRVLLRNSPSWIESLRTARQTEKLKRCDYSDQNAAHKALDALDQKRWHGDFIPSESLESAVELLKGALTTNSPDIADDPGSRLLNRDHVWFVEDILQYAQQRAEKEYVRFFNEKEFNFSRYSLAPTRMGNIARSVDSYAQSRYHINLVFFWTRLQKALQSKADYYKALQDAKTQLDFTVSLFWLTVFTLVLWLAALPFLLSSWIPLILIWAIGPIMARGCYLLGIQNYIAFADLLRSSLDLFRFDLLIDLKQQLPKDGRAEHLLWERLNKQMTYGEDPLITYKQE